MKADNESRGSNEYVVCALYHFVTLNDYADLKAPLHEQMLAHQVRGTLLLAQEGINGTIAGTRAGIDAVLKHLRADQRFSGVSCKESFSPEMPFHRTKVKLKQEIVTMGVPGIDPTHIAGTYVKPKDWNALISDPDVTVIDTRNEYEVQIGSFKRAINPHTRSFREFPAYAKNEMKNGLKKDQKVAMFCTGGIRCEKSTAYLKSLGFEDVYHLEGGILKYLEDVPEDESLWQGECFVFDDRVTVNHQLQQGQYDQCHACRLPITEADKASPDYHHGVSCPHCIDQLTDSRRQRFEEREKQVKLAQQRGESHIGNDAVKAQQLHRQRKLALKLAAKEKQRKAT
jgi:UPF0176 protein